MHSAKIKGFMKTTTLKEVSVQLEFIPRNERKLNSTTRKHYESQGLAPAAVFGKSIEPGICFVNTRHARDWHRGSIFDVTWEGQTYKASIAELQYHPVNAKLQHISFHLVGKNEVTHIEVPFHFVGQSVGEKSGGMVSHPREVITLKGKPGDIPEFIEVDVSALDINGKIVLGDLDCPPNTQWYNADLEWAIATCAHVKVQVEETPEVEATETAEAAEAPATEEAA